jgi:hypothetical protein
MKTRLLSVALAMIVAVVAWKVAWMIAVPNLHTHAQVTATAVPYQVGVGSATHTSCTIVANATEFCFASDGLWESLSGGPYAQVVATLTSAGVTINGVGPQTSFTITAAVGTPLSTLTVH